jgi:UDP-glucose:(heptosyl)LPS alpha-1,3-glucosyltransferase
VPKARIAVVSPFVDKRHGTERCLAEQLERWVSEYEIHLFSSRVEDLDLNGIAWHRVPEIPGPHLAKYLFWFAANHFYRWRERRRSGRAFDLVYSPGINCFDADVVIVHIVFAEFLRQVEQTLRLSRNPVKAWPRIFHRRLYYRLIIALERRTYAPGTAWLAAVSRKTWGDVERHYGPRRPETIAYNGIDPLHFSPEIRQRIRPEARKSLGIAHDRFVLLLVGNDFKKKGLHSLLQAVQKIGGQRLLVMVCGQDDPAPFEQYRFAPGAVQLVFLPIRRDVEFYYAAADAYIGPSLEDAFPIPPIEAMASGLPVLVSRQSGTCEVVSHGHDALILEDPTDIDGLTQQILSLLEDDSLRRRLAENGAVTARKLTWDANAELMKRLFERVLANG